MVGTHGLTIRQGEAVGLLLPIVAVESGWDALTFLSHVCRKAGLPTTAWQDDEARLQTFEALLIEGSIAPALLKHLPVEVPAPFLPGDVQRLAEHCRHNVVALLQGATPNYYLPTCPDANVQGAAICARFPAQHLETTTGQLSLRPGLPLQSTLYQCCEAIARGIQAHAISAQVLQSMRVDVAILHDCAMHGTVADPQLEGVDPQRAALLIAERDRYAWSFDDGLTVDDLLQSTANILQLHNATVAGLYSLAADCSCRSFSVSNLPQPQPGPRTRPPAVAGTFYPAEPAALQALVAQCCRQAEAGAAQPTPWPAVLFRMRACATRDALPPRSFNMSSFRHA